MSRALRWLIATLLFIALLVLVEQYLGWSSILSSWSQISATQLISLTLLTLLSYLLRAERVYRYFGRHNAHSRRDYIRISFLHNALNNFLPMRLGEASFPLLMKRRFRHSFADSTAGLIWIRLMDLHVLLLIGAIALGSLAPLLAIVASGALLAGPIAIYWLRARLFSLLPLRLATKLRGLTHLLPGSWSLLRFTYLITLIIWLVKLCALALILQVFLPIASGPAWIAVISADISGVLPIHGLAGSGTYEAAMLAALIPLGFTPAMALAAAVNVHIYLLAVSALSVPLALLIPSARHT